MPTCSCQPGCCGLTKAAAQHTSSTCQAGYGSSRHHVVLWCRLLLLPPQGPLGSTIIRRSIQGMLEELEYNLWEAILVRLVDYGHTVSPELEMAALRCGMYLRVLARAVAHGYASSGGMYKPSDSGAAVGSCGPA